MEKSHLNYEVIPADIDESIYDHQSVNTRVVSLAEDKCKRVAETHPNNIIIAADTLTTNKSGTVFSKPKPDSNPLDAAMQLSGQQIYVYTGCCVYIPGRGYQSKLSVGEVQYQIFDRKTLERVAENDNPQIRSGALGVFVDAPGFTLIESVRGSYTGMYGLPMEFIYKQLDSFSE